MYVIITHRLIRTNTGATQPYAPRTAHSIRLHVSGPFESEKTAQRAVLHALSVHTTLSAQVWSWTQIRDALARGAGVNGQDMQQVLTEAMRCLESLVTEDR
ncbi:MAG: hypothetical protein JNM56_29165 [Planctomycetia bacterium]|nr:hypothetical protein [Planctomycetia bacterium]